MGVWGSAGSVGLVGSAESKYVFSSNGGVWDGRLFGVICWVSCVLVSLTGMHAVRRR